VLANTTNGASKSPTPSNENRRPLRHVRIHTKPLGRRLDLDYREGVKFWSMRLAAGETGIYVSGIQFLATEDGGGESDDEGHHKEQAEEEEEEEPDVESTPRGKTKRGRGRPRKKAKGKGAAAGESPKGKSKTTAKEPEKTEIHVKLNGSLASHGEDGQSEWDMDLIHGLNVLELGEKDGMVWTAYLERLF